MRGQHAIPLRIALVYALFAGLWNLLSDRLVTVFATVISPLSVIQPIKDWVFVLLSTALIYLLLRYELWRYTQRDLVPNDGEVRFRQLIEKNADAIVIVDREGVVRFANPAAEMLFGRSVLDLLGKPFGFPVVAGDKADLDIIRPGVVTAIAEMRVVETLWEGTPTYLAALRDITDRKHAEAALREITLLREAERLKDEFVSNVSHELRTPLSVLTLLSGNLETLYERLDEQKRRNLVHDIRGYVRLLNDLIAGVLEISRIDGGRTASERQELDLAHIAREEADKQLPLAQKKNQLLRVIGVEQLIMIGNEGQIRQIIRNLLNNAIKYTSNGGQIICECRLYERTIDDERLATNLITNEHVFDTQVEAWPIQRDLAPGQWACLRVSDTGIGISSADQERIFERFYRVETQGNIPGTGLGLSIVWELVKLHAGAIAVASLPGQGSSFVIYLPLAVEESGEQANNDVTTPTLRA